MTLPQELDLAASEGALGPLPRLCNLIIVEALRTNAHAIRLQPGDAESGEVEYERDGEWRKVKR